MRKLFAFFVFVICVFGVCDSWCANARYNCDIITQTNKSGYSNDMYMFWGQGDKYYKLTCGHEGVMGCDDGAVVLLKANANDKHGYKNKFYRCHAEKVNHLASSNDYFWKALDRRWENVGASSVWKCGEAQECLDYVKQSNEIFCVRNQSDKHYVVCRMNDNYKDCDGKEKCLETGYFASHLCKHKHDNGKFHVCKKTDAQKQQGGQQKTTITKTAEPAPAKNTEKTAEQKCKDGDTKPSNSTKWHWNKNINSCVADECADKYCLTYDTNAKSKRFDQSNGNCISGTKVSGGQKCQADQDKIDKIKAEQNNQATAVESGDPATDGDATQQGPANSDKAGTDGAESTEQPGNDATTTGAEPSSQEEGNRAATLTAPNGDDVNTSATGSGNGDSNNNADQTGNGATTTDAGQSGQTDADKKQADKLAAAKTRTAAAKEKREAAEANYKEKKDIEQSKENRLLGAATIAATGVGAMELAQGLAEKKADEAAERDMTTYMATFRCDMGMGQNIKGGTTGIEVPGTAALAPMVAKYKALAADLKQRKEALGLKPGIESEIILDNSTMGLYDDRAMEGERVGAFTSLYRALKDPEGKDASEWNAQKEKSQKKIKGGAIALGAGVVGGIAGDLIINRDKDKNKDKDDSDDSDDGADGKCKYPDEDKYADKKDKETFACIMKDTELVYAKNGELSSVEHLNSGAKCNYQCKRRGWDVTLKSDSCATGFAPDKKNKACVKSTANTPSTAAAADSATEDVMEKLFDSEKECNKAYKKLDKKIQQKHSCDYLQDKKKWKILPNGDVSIGATTATDVDDELQEYLAKDGNGNPNCTRLGKTYVLNATVKDYCAGSDIYAKIIGKVPDGGGRCTYTCNKDGWSVTLAK